MPGRASVGVLSGKARRLAAAGRDAEIVGAVERGESMRAVAGAYGLALSTAHHIARRAFDEAEHGGGRSKRGIRGHAGFATGVCGVP